MWLIPVGKRGVNYRALPFLRFLWRWQPAMNTHVCPAGWLASAGRSLASKSAEVRRMWQIYDDWVMRLPSR